MGIRRLDSGSSVCRRFVSVGLSRMMGFVDPGLCSDPVRKGGGRRIVSLFCEMLAPGVRLFLDGPIRLFP